MSPEDKRTVTRVAVGFGKILAEMTPEERVLFFEILTDQWCPHCGCEQDPHGCTCRRDD